MYVFKHSTNTKNANFGKHSNEFVNLNFILLRIFPWDVHKIKV